MLLSIPSPVGPIILVVLVASVIGISVNKIYKKAKKIENMKIKEISDEEVSLYFYQLIGNLKDQISTIVGTRIFKGFLSTKRHHLLPMTDGKIIEEEWFSRELFFRLMVIKDDGKEGFLFVEQKTGDYCILDKKFPVSFSPMYSDIPFKLSFDDPGPEENAPPHGNNTREKINISELLNEGSELEGNEDKK